MFLGSIFYIRILKNNYKKGKNLQTLILSLGIIIIPISFYLIFFGSFNLIDYSLQLQEPSKHGYIFLFIITLPFLLLFYWLIISLINKYFKRKYNRDILD